MPINCDPSRDPQLDNPLFEDPRNREMDPATAKTIIPAPGRHLVKPSEVWKNKSGVVNFDEHADRGDIIRAAIPVELSDRVFVIGAWSNPEALKQADLGTFDEIGWKLAEDCRSGSDKTWGHELLKHNAEELSRMTDSDPFADSHDWGELPVAPSWHCQCGGSINPPMDRPFVGEWCQLAPKKPCQLPAN